MLRSSILVIAAIAAPAVSHAQTGDGERALLNHIENPVGAVTAIANRGPSQFTLVEQPIDGGRALGGWIPVSAFVAGGFDAVAPRSRISAPVSGARALLGR